MANQEHLDILKQGVEVWNKWREYNPKIQPNLGGVGLNGADLKGINFSKTILTQAIIGGNANLSGANLSQAFLLRANFFKSNLSGANLTNADIGASELSMADMSGTNLTKAKLNQANLYHTNLTGARLNGAILNDAKLNEANLTKARLIRANLFRADLSSANLRKAVLSGANLTRAILNVSDLRGANLIRATLYEANLNGANLSGAILKGANLSGASLLYTHLQGAKIRNCTVYGISAWNVELDDQTDQLNLVITPDGEPTITVDNLEVAQFLYLLLNNPKIRDVIDTIAKKAVLILGRFTPKRKAVLDAIREALRTHGYVPILFDFDKPSSQDLTETVSTLAHLSRFIIADLTEPSSIPKELEAIVPTLAVPVQPLLEGSIQPYAMFKDYWKYRWVLEVYRYNGLEELLASFKEHVIEPAERKAIELAKLRAREFEKQ
ncbi:MAG: pentapeptide repeat-containing protein [Ktedonobacteraceae bacterium]